MELEFSRQVFEESLNIKLHKNSSSESRVVPCGQTNGRRDGHEKTDSRFSRFCETASKGRLILLKTERSSAAMAFRSIKQKSKEIAQYLPSEPEGRTRTVPKGHKFFSILPNSEQSWIQPNILSIYSRTSNNGHCRGIQILSVIGGVR
jgi:hypothetical protein